ncbi:FAD-dependent oxidoreductase [Myxococcota bacterium]|nr:FAD-dependent oxidoreductase [Myxococcota bacterium]
MAQAVEPRRAASVERWQGESDVLVVGFGSAGVCAASQAARDGAEVLAFERAWQGGGTSAESTGQIYMGGGTPLQRACGFEDDPDEMAKYLEASCGPGADVAKIRLFSERSVEHFHWITDQGIRFDEDVVDYQVSTMPAPGKALSWTGSERAYPFCEIARPAPRGHNVNVDGTPSGELLMRTLIAGAQRAGVRVQPQSDVRRLIVENDGHVVGVEARIDGDLCCFRAHSAVVLATGGFVSNEEMLQRHAPELLRCGRPIAAETSDDGLGIQMGMAAGGETIRMGSACIVLGFAYGNRKNIRGILVNGRGQRYVNEDVYQSLHGEIALLRQDGDVYLIVDDTIYEPNPEDPELGGTTYPLLAVAETVEELEQELGMPDRSLTHTVNVYNENARRGEDPFFHKESCWLQALDTPPFAAIDLRVGKGPYSVFTLGGLRTDSSQQVQTSSGAPVPGLFAAGRTASGIPAQGYNSGLSLADCTFSGRVAGAAAAALRP